MAHMGQHPAAGGPAFYAPVGPSSASSSGVALLRQPQQGAGGSNGAQSRGPAPPPLGLHLALHDPSSLSVHGAVPGSHPQPPAPGMASFMPGLTSGFRPGSRGPPPGFAGYQPAQHAQQALPHLNGGAVPGTHPQPTAGGDPPPSPTRFAATHPPVMGGGGHAAEGRAAAAAVAANETSLAKGRRRKGKAAPPVAAPAAASQFPGGATLHDPDIQAGRLQQARERFYSLNS